MAIDNPQVLIVPVPTPQNVFVVAVTVGVDPQEIEFPAPKEALLEKEFETKETVAEDPEIEMCGVLSMKIFEEKEIFPVEIKIAAPGEPAFLILEEDMENVELELQSTYEFDSILDPMIESFDVPAANKLV